VCITMEAQKKSKRRNNKSHGGKPSPGEHPPPKTRESVDDVDPAAFNSRAPDPRASPMAPPSLPSPSLPISSENNNNNNKRRNRRGGAGAGGEKKEEGEGQRNDINKVMERDSEYRRLNAKIKEQEYRMRQMESNAKSHRDLSDRIAKKVEEEVRQKLSKAMIMSTMYKAEESSPPRRSSEVRDGGKRESRKKWSEKRSESEGEVTVEPSGFQNPRSQIRLPKDAAPFRNQQPTSSIKEEPSEIEEHQQKMETKAKEKERFFLQLESEVKKRIDEIRRDKLALQDFCLLGPSNGAPEYALKCHEFESLILDKLSRGDVIGACQEKYCHKLTEVKLKQLGLFHAVLSSAMNSAARTTKESLITQVSFILLPPPPFLNLSRLADHNCLPFRNFES
jgi:hypothetical protein